MVSVVTGSSTGLVNSSRDVLGGAGELGNAATGRAGERVTVNAADGSLIIQDRDEYLVGVGPDVDLLRTYNRKGTWDGDNGDGWRLGYYRRVSGLSAPVNTSGSSIRRIEADGSETTYNYNGTRYICTDGAGQYDALSFDGTNWTWTDGETGVKELYEPSGAGSYRLKQITDPDGNFIRVDYGASGLITTLATYKAGTSTALETLTLSYIGTELQKVSTAYVDAQGLSKTRSVTSYIELVLDVKEVDVVHTRDAIEFVIGDDGILVGHRLRAVERGLDDAVAGVVIRILAEDALGVVRDGADVAVGVVGVGDVLTERLTRVHGAGLFDELRSAVELVGELAT